jgi:uncharacterized membrane protein
LPFAFRIGRESVVGAEGGAEGRIATVEWTLKRNCSMSPRQLLMFFISLCVFSSGIAAYFWTQGARLVMPFTAIELLALAGAMLAYGRHAGDLELIALASGRLTVLHTNAGNTERAEFDAAWVRVEPEHNDRSLIELSGQGQKISVGRFVRPELRRQLADELRMAVRRWQSNGQAVRGFGPPMPAASA